MGWGNTRGVWLWMLVCALLTTAVPAGATTVTLTSDRAAPQPVGTTIHWTTTGAGGTAPYSFKWWVYDGVTWKMLRDWNTSTSYDWTPSVANSAYRVGVWVRSAGKTADVDEANEGAYFAITVAAPPATTSRVSAVTLTANQVPPQPPGSTITWSVQPTGGVAPYAYKWWLYNGTSWSLLKDWGASASFTWTPAAANSAYRLGVWVRSAGNTSDVDEANQSAYFAIAAAAAARVTSITLVPDRQAPQAVGTSVTFTAAAVGGVAPHSYKWWLYDGAQWILLRDWAAGAAFVWQPTAANANAKLGVWTRSAGSTSDVDESNISVSFPITAASKVTSVILTPDRTAPQPAGTTVRWTATAAGGVAPLSYRWWIDDGLQWTALTPWTTDNVIAWTPPRPNEAFRIGVWVRSSTNTSDVDEANISQVFAVRGGVPDCLTALEPAVVTVDSGGGVGSARVTSAQAACGWTVSSQATWVSVTSARNGVGDGDVTFTVAPNVDRVSRTGFVMIGARALSITQGGASTPSGCTYAVYPTVLDVGFGNGTATVAVTAPAGCTWSATASGFTKVAPGSGAGSGTLTVSVENNTAPEPRGTVLMVAGRAVTLTQAGRAANPQGCTYSLSPSEAVSDFRAANGTVAVSAPSGCAWTAKAMSSFVHLTGATTGSGSGNVAYVVDTNGTGSTRSGLLMVGGETVTVTQGPASPAPPCVFAVSPSTANVSYAGGSGAVSVSTTSGCQWGVLSHTDWIHVTDSSGPTGSGNVWYSVDGNSGAARAGTLVVAGQTLTISQGEPPSSPNASEITWVSQPDPERVGQCAGNCGAGCGTFFNPCGGPHYWEHTLLGEPQYVGDDWEPVCTDSSSWFVVTPRYTVLARWTYHGLKSRKCEEHDSTCRNLNLIPFLPADKVLCLATAGLVGLNGLNYCEDAQPFDWSYDIVDVGHGPPVAFIDGVPSCN